MIKLDSNLHLHEICIYIVNSCNKFLYFSVSSLPHGVERNQGTGAAPQVSKHLSTPIPSTGVQTHVGNAKV